MADLFETDGWDGSLDDVLSEQPLAEEPAPAQEPAAEAEPVDDPAAQEEPDAQPRDPETGRFVPKNIDESVAVDDPELQAFLAKYKDDPLEALKAAAEAQRHVGSVHQEIGQLRQQMEEFTNRPAPEPVTPHTPVTQDLIDNNPALAVEPAYAQQNQPALNAAFESWKLEDPTSAALWVSSKQIEQVNQQWAERYAQLEQRLTPLQQQQENDVFAQGVARLAADDPQMHERIMQGAQTLPQEVAGALYKLLENGSATEKLGAYRALAELTKAPAQPATPDVQQLAREQALEAERAIAEASVVSATATKTEPPKSVADVIGDEWASYEKSYSDGWNIP